MVIDTHIWIWWMTGSSELSAKAVRLLEEMAQRPVLSDISLWEVAMLAAKGRVKLHGPLETWFAKACQAVQVTPINSQIATRVAGMSDKFHGDPADRLILATAAALGLPLVTRDKKLRASGMVEILELPG